VTSTFTTGNGAEVTAPSLLDSTPFRGATNVPVNPVVRAVFSRLIDPVTVNSTSSFLRDASGNVTVPGSAALDPKPGFAAVAATNAAIIALAKAFAEQGIKDGVQVNSIVPGAVMTGRRRSFLQKWAPAHNLSVKEATERFPEQVGISRYGRPEEIADLLGFMVSPFAKWMTGTSVRMDGGEIKGT